MEKMFMKRGRVLVEQVLKDGTIIEEYDTSLTTSEMSEVLLKYFPKLKKSDGKPTFYVGEYKKQKYAIRCKNITYLGNPHPTYKKRIQIAEDLYSFYDAALAIGAKPILMGIYTSDENTIFVDFKIDTYIDKKAHNSSAHVYASDLYAATVDGYFQKVDYFGNTVTAFRPDVIDVFLDEFFGINSEEEIVVQKPKDLLPIQVDSKMVFDKSGDTALEISTSVISDTEGRVLPYVEGFKETIAPEFRKFFGNVEKNWHGIKCYKEMIASSYKNKYQPEWVGFYLEFCFEKFIKENQLESVITYYQDKKDGGVDLDLFFPEIDSFGDLKAHSEDSRGIQGNDWNTIFSILNRNDESSHIYYIVCEHATEKDSEHDYEVTKFWNTEQKKPDLLSYHKRMKNNVTLKKVYILDINYDNKEYLTMFKQGINSNGKPRAPKIMIEHDNLKYFILEEIVL